MSKHILLTGGTGVIGTQSTEALLQKGYRVSHLSRKPGTNPQVSTFLWDIHKGQIDEKCLDGVDTIVHLAGAGIADKRWSDSRKKEIINSRTKSIELIYNLMKQRQHEVTTVISASGVGYYSDRGDQILTETDTPAADFMGECCVLWEGAVDEGEQFGLRIVKFRTGVVLTTAGGALPQLAMPIKFGVGSPLGSGKQWMPWIHEQDALNMYLMAIEQSEMTGVFNMVAPNPVTNKQLTQAVAKQLRRPLWLPNVPAFLLKLIFGEMSTVVLGSTRASSQKIEDAGFKFQYPTVTLALKQIYG